MENSERGIGSREWLPNGSVDTYFSNQCSLSSRSGGRQAWVSLIRFKCLPLLYCLALT
jgi:hypothetical protein